GRPGGQADRQLAGGDRTQTLLRVKPVVLTIGDVVAEVHSAREQTERRDAEQRELQARGVPRVPGEEGRHQERAVLGPLPRTQRDDEGSQARGARYDADGGGLYRGGGPIHRHVAYWMYPSALRGGGASTGRCAGCS